MKYEINDGKIKKLETLETEMDLDMIYDELTMLKKQWNNLVDILSDIKAQTNLNLKIPLKIRLEEKIL